MKKIGEMMFRNLPMKIVISNSVRAKYYKEGDKIPKKYPIHYFDFIDGVLCDLSTGLPVISNPDAAGKPKTMNIGANKLHSIVYGTSGGARHHIIKVKDTLKAYFLQNIQPFEIKQFPIHVEFKFYINDTPDAPDRDNLALFYEKTFFDCIQLERIVAKGKKEININGFLPDDSINYINGSDAKVFFTQRTPYLIINFYNYESEQEFKDDRANVNLDHTITRKVQKLAEKFAHLSLKDKKRTIGEEEVDLLQKFWQQEYDFFFETLSNEFLN